MNHVAAIQPLPYIRSKGANLVVQLAKYVANTEVKIIKEDGIEDVDEPGEITARGPQITIRY